MTDDRDDGIRRKRLSFRAWHRGMKELDLILGRFADQRLRSMSEEELDRFERILAHPDPVLLRWLTGREPVPAEYDDALLREITSAWRG